MQRAPHLAKMPLPRQMGRLLRYAYTGPPKLCDSLPVYYTKLSTAETEGSMAAIYVKSKPWTQRSYTYCDIEKYDILAAIWTGTAPSENANVRCEPKLWRIAAVCASKIRLLVPMP